MSHPIYPNSRKGRCSCSIWITSCFLFAQLLVFPVLMLVNFGRTCEKRFLCCGYCSFWCPISLVLGYYVRCSLWELPGFIYLNPSTSDYKFFVMVVLTATALVPFPLNLVYFSFLWSVIKVHNQWLVYIDLLNILHAGTHCSITYSLSLKTLHFLTS